MDRVLGSAPDDMDVAVVIAAEACLSIRCTALTFALALTASDAAVRH